ncbi:hypothetical protein ABPG75_000533 [Micractinium tetrahymenae]
MADSGRVWWLLIAVACQFVWGIYPAALRYLQTKASEPLTSLQLSFLINLLACPALLLGSTLPAAARKALRRRQLRQRQQAAQHGAADSPAAAAMLPRQQQQQPSSPLPGSSKAAAAKERMPVGDSALAEPLLGPEDLEEQAAAVAAPDAEAAAEPAGPEGAASGFKPDGTIPRMATSPPEPSSPAAAQGGARAGQPAGPSRWQQAAVLAGTTFFLSGLLLAQVFSLLFTTAYLSQMVFLLAPVIVALLARALFRQPLPPGMWPALLLMLLGCGMVIGSKAEAAAAPRTALAPSAAWQPAGAAWMAGAAAGPCSREVSLFAGRGEEAWLCAAAFGGTPLARLCAPDPPGAAAAGPGSQRWSGSAAAASESFDVAEQGDDDAAQPGQRAAGTAAAAVHKKRRPKPGPPPPKPPPGPPRLGLRDAVGIFLSFLGACCLAGFMLVVQRCGGVVSNQQVLWANFTAQSALSCALLYLFERGRLNQLLHLGLPELGAVAALAGGINWGANLVQQLCIQRLGAPATAAFLPVRLLGSLAASFPLLSEGLAGPMQWGGCATLLAAVSWYLLQQKKAAEHSAAAAAFEADVAVANGAAAAAAPVVQGADEP